MCLNNYTALTKIKKQTKIKQEKCFVSLRVSIAKTIDLLKFQILKAEFLVPGGKHNHITT